MGKSTLKKWKEVLYIFACVVLKTSNQFKTELLLFILISTKILPLLALHKMFKNQHGGLREMEKYHI